MTVLANVDVGSALRAFLAPTDVVLELKFFIARKAMQTGQDLDAFDLRL